MIVYRLTATLHNEHNFTLDRQCGEHKRLNIAVFSESDTSTEERLNVLNLYTFPDKGSIYFTRLNSIGKAFIYVYTLY